VISAADRSLPTWLPTPGAPGSELTVADRRWSLCGIPAAILENPYLRVTVLPELGGKIYSVVSKADDTELLWHNPRLDPRRPPFGANFDNYFTGGWDHPFPTLNPSGSFPDTLPYLGELWSLPWQILPGDDGEDAVTLGVSTVIVPCRVRCRIRLEPDAPRLTLGYSITNVSPAPVEVTWGLHPCLAIEEGTRFRLPVTEGQVVQSPGGGLGQEDAVYQWPLIDTPAGPLDMSAAAAPEACVYGLHQFWLEDGWFEVTRTSGTRARFSFPRAVFPVINLWAVYGGWRGIYHAALEPWSTRALSLEGAAAIGEQITLRPKQEIRADVHLDVVSA
jgi:hypothetical protein